MATGYTTGNLKLVTHDEGDLHWWADTNWNMQTLDTQVSENEDELVAARGTALTLNDRLSVEINLDGSLKIRPTVEDTESEVIAARGIMPSLADRLTVSLQDNGSLRPGVLKQASLANSLVYNDGYVGTPKTTEDDFNRLRNEMKVLKGTLNWETDTTIAVQPLVNEVIAARGTMTSLNARLSVSLAANGTFNPIPQTQIQKSTTYNDQFSGVPMIDLQDDLNWTRTVLRKLKDTTAGAKWDDVLSMTVKQVIDEVTAARGTKSSIDARLDISINEDGTLKSGAVAAQTAIANSAVYDDTYIGLPANLENDLNRIRHELKLVKGSVSWLSQPPTDLTSDINTLDSQVQSILSGLANAILDRADTTVFYPVQGSWQTRYRLHQFQARESALSTGKFWFNVKYSAPLTVTFGIAIGPGGPDSTNPAFSLNLWLYVYVIANTAGTQALIYSANPPHMGPSLSDVSFNGYNAWRYVAEVVNGNAGAWEIVPCRRHGFHVEYEQAQELLAASGGGGGPTPLSLAIRVPKTSLNAQLLLSTFVDEDANVAVSVTPASVPVAGEQMLLQDIVPISPKSAPWKIRCFSGASGTGAASMVTNANETTGWCHTDTGQRIDVNVVSLGGGLKEWWIYVLGYEVLPDFSAVIGQWV